MKQRPDWPAQIMVWVYDLDGHDVTRPTGVGGAPSAVIRTPDLDLAGGSDAE